MLVAVAGGHGQIARRLTHLLVARGDQVRGLIPGPDDADDLRADGAEPVVCDLEHEWTIVRPGPLTDDSGSGRVRIDSQPFRERVPREDVAAVLSVVLHVPRSARRVLYVGGGEDEIEAAVEKVLGETGASAPVGAGEPRRP
jgi:nucleoside-diphosphate-sugar epimerase